METKALPLFPDNLEPRDQCWNCGGYGLITCDGILHCRCGCTWRNSTPREDEYRRKLWRSAEERNAIIYKIDLVDFTKPGAPNCPA